MQLAFLAATLTVLASHAHTRPPALSAIIGHTDNAPDAGHDDEASDEPGATTTRPPTATGRHR